jgi:hypothetical protein
MYHAEVIFHNNTIQIVEYNHKLNKKTITNLIPKNLERFYDCSVQFDKSLTVEGFMNALKPFFKKMDKQFYSFTRGYKLMHYYKQMIKPPEKESKNKSEILFVELYWHAELWSKNDFNYYASIHGVTKDKNTKFGFSLSPINNWKHYPFRLNPNFTCLHINPKGKQKEIPKLFSTKREFTLYDVIRYFFYELTYHGYTEHLIERRESLDKQIEEIKSGKTKMYTMEEVMLKVNKRFLKEALKAKDEKLVAKLTKKIEKLELKVN